MISKVSLYLIIRTHLLNEFIHLTSHFKFIFMLRQPTVKVGDLVEYCAPQETPHNPSDICQGEVTEILPSEGLNIITDTHLIIDGLHAITYGRPIRLDREGEWISTDNCECIVDRQDDGVRCHSGNLQLLLMVQKRLFMRRRTRSCFPILVKRKAMRVVWFHVWLVMSKQLDLVRFTNPVD
jgi:hypothetical protein